MSSEYVLYACPTGPLAAQIDTYFAETLALCGPNPAHDFPPHCTLTNFFSDIAGQVPVYLDCIDSLAAHPRPTPVVAVTGLCLDEHYHGIELASPWLRNLAVNFATHALSLTRQTPIRAREWLHLSLAYGFAPELGRLLGEIAERVINPWTAVVWELRFYSRTPAGEWICHAAWPLY